eukprot:TRINITY_DN36289_c0_g1_i1.p1 TRINITY_DN36289_c0_g1~~TRINITY_DN36289_c0_g1_i1.p1  ORF type:complete len:362 (+),score=37.27 TRINITY_DN36289_c0_g1_i1:72-1157(+)
MVGWVFSPSVDFTAFFLPTLVALCYIPICRSIDPETVPLVHYCLLVVSVDVAHVWTSLLRADSEARSRRPMLFYGSPFVLFVILAAAHYLLGESVFWTIVAYMAIHHFTKQHYGLICLYKARAGERSKVDFWLDWLSALTAAWVPVLVMHASATGKFKWFNNGEKFIFRLPESAKPLLWFLYAAVALVWLSRFAYLAAVGKPNYMKLWVMLGAWLTWFMGGCIEHEVLSLAFINLIHGISSMVLVYQVSQRRFGDWEKKAPDSMDLLDRLCLFLSRPGHWPVYLVFIVSIAAVEEFLWDSLVYHIYLPEERLVHLSPVSKTIASAALVLPQVTHYYLDAFLWKMDGSNPGLREAIMPRNAD